MKSIIRLITNESGDWEVLLLNGKVYEEGHDIPAYTWVNLIHDLGHELMGDTAKYWAHNKYDLEDLFISYETRDDSPIVVKNTKKHWNELGINDSNADFVKVDEWLN